jgi:RNA-binding protein 8A
VNGVRDRPFFFQISSKMADNFEVNLDIEDEEMADEQPHQPSAAAKRKGRGFTTETARKQDVSRGGKYESVPASNPTYQKSVEGWIILVTGIHEEASEEDVSEVFADFGQIVNIHLNLNRRTGFVKVLF